MKRYFLPFVCVIFFVVGSVNAQQAKESIFSDVKSMIENAREQGAEWLSPEFFAQAKENFAKANEYYVNNESTRDIMEKLSEARRFCERSMEVVKLGKMTLKAPIEARESAIKVNADKYAETEFSDAEELFRDAAREIEDGDLDDAREIGAEAESMFRTSELKSIKDRILGEARRLVAEAAEIEADEVAPATYTSAKNLLNEVESLLKNDRYAVKTASEKARECIYQANHAIYLTNRIKQLREDNKNWEQLILESENILTTISAKFDERPFFDRGFESSVGMIVSRIEKLQADNKALIAQNSNLQEEFNIVQEQATTTGEALRAKQDREARVEKVKALFLPNEAEVSYDGDNLMIRLIGLNFQPGKTIIQPEFFSLLTKVQMAMKEFPDQHVLVEGHTDSRGIPRINKNLSEQRAKTVREYIIANAGISREQITAVGYGDTKPVASNKTAEGRAINRRIDILINLSN